MDKSLACDICATPMEEQHNAHAVEFACPKCDQVHTYSLPDGHHTFRVLGKLFPSSIDRNSVLYQEFLDYRLAEVAFDSKARWLSGLLIESERMKRVIHFSQLVAIERGKHPPMPAGILRKIATKLSAMMRSA